MKKRSEKEEAEQVAVAAAEEEFVALAMKDCSFQKNCGCCRRFGIEQGKNIEVVVADVEK